MDLTRPLSPTGERRQMWEMLVAGELSEMVVAYLPASVSAVFGGFSPDCAASP